MTSYDVLAQPPRKQLGFTALLMDRRMWTKKMKKSSGSVERRSQKKSENVTGNSCDDLSVIKHPRRYISD